MTRSLSFLLVASFVVLAGCGDSNITAPETGHSGGSPNTSATACDGLLLVRDGSNFTLSECPTGTGETGRDGPVTPNPRS